jgi:hypothetical protein
VAIELRADRRDGTGRERVVSVKRHADLAGHRCVAAVARRREPAVTLVVNDPGRPAALELVTDAIGGCVGRGVVDDQDLEPGIGLLPEALDRAAQALPLGEAGDDDREARG